MKTFENKTVLITGGTSGIGKATALAFAKEGANVVVSGRRVAEGEKVAREITSAGGSALFVQADVAREDDIVALVAKTVGAFGALHIRSTMPAPRASSACSPLSRRSSIIVRFATSISVACCSR
jgi:NAD(P)-dependent dehydrogenase (short-subunit alcohol dehydrogenase family)